MDDKEKGLAVSSTAGIKPSAPGAHAGKHRSEKQGRGQLSLVTVSISFTFLSHLWMHLNMLEQGLGLVPSIIYTSEKSLRFKETNPNH